MLPQPKTCRANEPTCTIGWVAAAGARRRPTDVGEPSAIPWSCDQTASSQRLISVRSNGISGLVDRMDRCHWGRCFDSRVVPIQHAGPPSCRPAKSPVPARPPRPRPGHPKRACVCAIKLRAPRRPVLRPTALALGWGEGRPEPGLSTLKCNEPPSERKKLASGWIRRPYRLKIGTVLRFAPGKSPRKNGAVQSPGACSDGGSATRSPPSR
jgi:hypothetical protein